MGVASKLGQLLPHWIEHNESHIEQLRDWQEQARAADLGEVADSIGAAAEAIAQANEELKRAGKMLPESGRHEH